MAEESGPTFRCRSLDGLYIFDIAPGETVSVGRSEHADCVIDNLAVARFAISFHNLEGRCVVRYERMRGSLLINGQRMRSDGQEVRPGDRIKILNVTFVVEELDC